VDRCALFVDAGYVLGDGAMAVHGTRNRDSVSWDYAGVVQILGNVARDRTGLPLLRCYWYEATVEGRRTPDHETLADLPGVKLRVGRLRPGRREGVESEIHRDLTTLARNRAISDALVVSAEEDLAQVVSDVQDLGIRVILVHIPVRGAWTVAPALRQECDDVVEISEAQLRPSVELVMGAEPAGDERQAVGAYAARAPANGHGPTGQLNHRQALPVGSHAAPPAIYTGPVIAEYQRAAQPAISQSSPVLNSGGGLGGASAGPAGSGASAAPGPMVPQGPRAAIAPAPGTAQPGPASQPATPAPAGMAPAGPAQPGMAPGLPAQPGLAGQHAAPPQPGAQPVAGQPGMAQPGGMAQGQPGAPQPAPGLPQRGQPAPRPAGQHGGAHAAPQPPASGLTQPYQAPGAVVGVAGQPGPAGQPGVAGQQGQLPPGLPPSGMAQPGLPAYQAAPPGQAGFRGQGPDALSGQAPAGSRLPQPGVPGQLPPGPGGQPAAGAPVPPGQPLPGTPPPSFPPAQPPRPSGPHEQRAAQFPAGPPNGGPPAGYLPQQGPHSGPQPAAQSAPVPQPVAVSLADAVQAAHGEGFNFGQAVARDAPALWLEAVLARKPRMPSDLEARLLQDSSLPIDSLLHDEVRHALRRGFWDALERVRH
jgi:NYN domain